MSEVLPILEEKLRKAPLDPSALELALKALELCTMTNSLKAAEELDGVVAKIYKMRQKNDGMES